MKILSDFLPILLFFATYKIWGIYYATAIMIGVSGLQALAGWIKYRRLDFNQMITLIIVLLLGGTTLLLRSETFIKWKPTAVYWVLAMALLGVRWLKEETLVEKMMGDKLKLPRRAWEQLNWWWLLFFSSMGALNLYVAYHYDTDSWVNFKLFGLLGGTIVFAIVQTLVISKYLGDAQINAKSPDDRDNLLDG